MWWAHCFQLGVHHLVSLLLNCQKVEKYVVCGVACVCACVCVSTLNPVGQGQKLCLQHRLGLQLHLQHFEVRLRDAYQKQIDRFASDTRLVDEPRNVEGGVEVQADVADRV